MAAEKSIRMREKLKSIFPDSWLRQAALDTGFVRRERKILIVPFFWTLVLGFGVEARRTLSSLRRAYERTTGICLVPSSFYDRFNEALVRFLKTALDQAFGEFRIAWAGVHERLERFYDVVVADSTVIKLHDGLQKHFPGARTNSAPAAAKLHSVFSVQGKGNSTVALSSERVGDKKKLKIGPWVDGRLLLFDLGYYRYQLFNRIRRNGGYFLSRLKINANPTICRVFRKVRGNSIPLEGERLQDVLSRLKRQVLDAEIEVEFQNRVYAGRKRFARQTFRLVAILNEDTKEHHCYITNIPIDVLDAEEIGKTYRARWEIELVFKELKSGYRLGQISSGRKPVAEALIYCTILTLLASRALLRVVAHHLNDRACRATAGRWWKLLSAYAQELQLLVIRPPREARSLRGLFEIFAHEVVDPHTNRLPLLLQENR